MAINFPDSPAVGDKFVSGAITWVWNGVTWDTAAGGGGSGGGTPPPINIDVGVPEAPLDGKQYGRQSANWTEVVGGGGGGGITVETDPLSLHKTGGTLTGPLNGTTATFSGTIAGKAGLVTVDAVGASPYTGGGSTSSAGLMLNKTAGAFNNMITGLTSGKLRWQLMLGNSNNEAGADAGSGFVIGNFSDAGVQLGLPMQISRATGATTFSQPIIETSDVRLKTNIETVADALSIIEQLDGVYFDKEGLPGRGVGLIAQEVQNVLPEVVFEAENWVTPEPRGDTPALGISYGNVVAVLVNAVKELSAKVTALEAASGG